VLIECFGGAPDRRNGAVAALARWLVAVGQGQDSPDNWTPLARAPDCVSAESDLYDPPAGSQFFAVDGEAVSVALN